MANASSKKFGKRAHGKSDGTGAMSSAPRDILGENMVLSNRDKGQESRLRGADSRFIMNEQRQDQAHNRDEEHGQAPRSDDQESEGDAQKV
jgi:hypothetical protein